MSNRKNTKVFVERLPLKGLSQGGEGCCPGKESGTMAAGGILSPNGLQESLGLGRKSFSFIRRSN